MRGPGISRRRAAASSAPSASTSSKITAGLCTATRVCRSDSGTSITTYPRPRSAVESRSASADGSLTKIVADPSTRGAPCLKLGGSLVTGRSLSGPLLPSTTHACEAALHGSARRSDALLLHPPAVEECPNGFADLGEFSGHDDNRQNEEDEPRFALGQPEHAPDVRRRAPRVKSLSPCRSPNGSSSHGGWSWNLRSAR